MQVTDIRQYYNMCDSQRIRYPSFKLRADAFRFSGDICNLVYITCCLKLGEHQLSQTLLNRSSNVWYPLEVTTDICNCCETHPWTESHFSWKSAQSHWQKGGCRREMEVAMLAGPTFITDVTHDTNNNVGWMESTSASIWTEKKEPKTIPVGFQSQP